MNYSSIIKLIWIGDNAIKVIYHQLHLKKIKKDIIYIYETECLCVCVCLFTIQKLFFRPFYNFVCHLLEKLPSSVLEQNSNILYSF